MTTQITTDNQLAQMEWAEGLEAEFLKKTTTVDFTSKRSSSCIHMRDKLEKGPGDTIRIGLRRQSTKAPATTGTSIENNEQSLQLEYMNVTIDEYADAVRGLNVIDRQRVDFELLDESKALLADQLANAWDRSFFNQVGGVADAANPTFEGLNTIRSPSSTHHIIAAANEAAIEITHVLTLDFISECVQLAKTLSPVIRPCDVPGYPYPLYICYVHPWQGYLLRQADTRWDDLMRDASQGGMIGNNPRVTGALGIWDGTLLVENTRVPTPGDATDGTQIRRAIFCGAQAAVCATGRIGGTPEKFRWIEKLFDYDREAGVLGGFIGGMKKSGFAPVSDAGSAGTAVDFATIVISTASAANDDGS